VLLQLLLRWTRIGLDIFGTPSASATALVLESMKTIIAKGTSHVPDVGINGRKLFWTPDIASR